MDFFGVTLIALLVYLFVKWKSNNRQSKMLKDVPGPKGYPIVGNAFDLLMTPRERSLQDHMEKSKKYGPVFKMHTLYRYFLITANPEEFEVILSSSKLISKGDLYRFFYPWMGTGLLTSTGQKWHSHRKMITPTFHFKKLESFVPIFHENSMILMQKFKQLAGTDMAHDVYPFIQRCALDVICETAMGMKIHAQISEHSEYTTAVYDVQDFTIRRAERFWLHNDFLFNHSALGKAYYKKLKVLHDFTSKVITEKKRQFALRDKTEEEDEDETGNKKKKAFLDLLLEASERSEGQKLTDEELREEVDTFMFAGHDTTSTAIGWTMLLLGYHQDIQQKVADELRDIFQDDPERAPTTRDLAEMKYLERVFKESLRMFPIAPRISRELTQDTQLGKYLIPEGTTVGMNIFALHRNPKYYPNPEKFDPDRFLPEEAQKRHPYSFVPFSAGPRNCIGQKFAQFEAKVILSNTIRRFKLEAVDKFEDIVLIPDITLKSLNGIKIKFSLRED